MALESVSGKLCLDNFVGGGELAPLTCYLNGDCLGGGFVVEHEGAPELAVLLAQLVWDFHNQPMIQQHQLWLLPAPREPPVPRPCRGTIRGCVSRFSLNP